MSTLLLRLAAPLQSWGTESKFDIRRTVREPTKSGVIGLLAAALGRRRDEDLSDLRALRFGVRVDREGESLRDYQTVWNSEIKKTNVTERYYLCDAVFLAGVEGEDETFLEQLDKALTHPVYPLFLGRRSCPPTLPLTLGIRRTDLERALREEPNLIKQYSPFGGTSRYDDEKSAPYRMLLDAGREDKVVVQRDLPLSYDPRHRQYRYRAVVEKHGVYRSEADATEHDPMKELGA